MRLHVAACCVKRAPLFTLQAVLDETLPRSSAIDYAMTLFKQLKQAWQHPLLHAQALLLQARLGSLLHPAENALQLVQQALDVLQSQVNPC